MKLQPRIVYKYRDWQKPNHKSMLEDNILYLSSPKDFNDPFDCRINSNFSLLSSEEEDQYITDLAIHGFEKSEKMGLDFKDVLADFEERFKDKTEFQKYADSLLFHHQDNCYAIFSCCKRWNSIPMWAHYANEHKGFCIGFWTKKLIDSHVFGKLGEVVYQATYPEIKPRVAKKDEQLMINSFIETHTKASAWKIENEYRFMSNHFPEEVTTEERRIRMENDIFAEVILGINISPDDKQEIVNLCNLKRIPVFQAQKEDFKFKIKRVLVK